MTNQVSSIPLLTAATATGAGEGKRAVSANRTYQASATATGALTADVDIEVSNDNVNWLVLGTISLADDDAASDGFASDAAWTYTRANVTAITGTGAAVTVTMGA